MGVFDKKGFGRILVLARSDRLLAATLLLLLLVYIILLEYKLQAGESKSVLVACT